MAAKSCCTDSASAELLQALDEFNREQWFECHETLEDLWVGSEWEMRDLYQGLLHVAVALHHWRNGNFGGAVSLLKSGSGCLRRVRAACQGVDVEAMVAAADRFREQLAHLGPERMDRIDRSLIPRVVTASMNVEL